MVKIVDVRSMIELKDKEGLLTPDELAKKKLIKLYPTRLFGHWLFCLDPDFELMKKYFRDQIVVDVGSGTDISTYRACCMARAKGYVGVDYQNNYDARLRHKLLSEEAWIKHDKEFEKRSDRLKHPREVPAALVYEKAQKFLRRLPDNSVSVYAGGIDTCMIVYHDEARDLEEQIVRVLDPNGAFIGHDTRLFNDLGGSYIPAKGLKLVVCEKGTPTTEVRIKEK